MDITNLKTRGFVNLAYPHDLRVAVLKAERSWEDFCSLPAEVKQLFSYSSNSTGVGYENKDGSGKKGDIKENFDVSLSGEVFLVDMVNKYSNTYPIIREFTRDALHLVEVMSPFVIAFARECEKNFNLVGFENEISGGRDSFFIRFVHYPPQKSTGEPTAQAHLDQSGFTLHLFESAPGLECLTFEWAWIPMPVSESETVIIPDMQMQLRSGGLLKALWHRVVATEETSRVGRYSAVSFVQFRDTPVYNKEKSGRLQEKPEGFNYEIDPGEFSKLFK
jgi:isopenicillin N synthase-like dioxygenase